MIYLCILQNHHLLLILHLFLFYSIYSIRLIYVESYPGRAVALFTAGSSADKEAFRQHTLHCIVASLGFLETDDKLKQVCIFIEIYIYLNISLPGYDNTNPLSMLIYQTDLRACTSVVEDHQNRNAKELSRWYIIINTTSIFIIDIC